MVILDSRGVGWSDFALELHKVFKFFQLNRVVNAGEAFYGYPPPSLVV